MNYKTVFDAAHQGHSFIAFPAFGLIFSAVGVLLVAKPALMQSLMPKGVQGLARTAFGWVFLLFSIFWTLFSFTAVIHQHQYGEAALREGNFDVVAGPVTDFVPMPYGGHAKESFTVGGRHFSYSDYIITSGFNNTASHGGPIRPGLDVRVSYIGNVILRLEVAQ